MTQRLVSGRGGGVARRQAAVGWLLAGVLIALYLGYLCGAGEVVTALWLLGGGALGLVIAIRPEVGVYALALTVTLAPRAFELGRYSVTSTELLVGWLSVCLLGRLALRRQRLVRTPLDRPLLAFALVVSFVTVAREVSARGLGAFPDSLLVTGKNWLIYAFIYFLAVHSITERRQIQVSISLLVIGAAAGALASYLLYLPFAKPVAALPIEITRLGDVRFASPNQYAIFALMISCIALARLIHRAAGASRLAALVVPLCMFLPWRYTYSRTGFLLAGVGFVVLFYGWRRWLAPLAALVCLSLWWAIPTAYQYRVAQASPFLGSESFRHYVIARAHLPDLAWVLAHPSGQILWGVGLYPGWEVQDNIYLFTLLSGGFFSLAALGWLLAATGGMLLRLYRAGGEASTRALALGALGSLALMLVGGTVMNSFLTPLLATSFWLVVALAGREYAIERADAGRYTSPRGLGSHRRARARPGAPAQGYARPTDRAESFMQHPS
jgi:hypothetical protein